MVSAWPRVRPHERRPRIRRRQRGPWRQHAAGRHHVGGGGGPALGHPRTEWGRQDHPVAARGGADPPHYGCRRDSWRGPWGGRRLRASPENRTVQRGNRREAARRRAGQGCRRHRCLRHRGALARTLRRARPCPCRIPARRTGCGPPERPDLRHPQRGGAQRVQIARALMPDPELMLLDEPAAGLDLGGREDLVARLAALAADVEAPALVLVTHHVEEIPPSFTDVLLLREGRIVAAGPVEITLTAANLSATFGLPLELERHGERWSARAAGKIERMVPSPPLASQ